jgi:hypothetical protein
MATGIPAKRAGKRLKVYAAEIDGLHEWLVAAPNRPQALEAFGIHQDLFAQGLAREETDPALIEQATKAPGVPLRRPKGSDAPFAPATGEADWSAAAPKGAKAKPKTKADRSGLDRAEARLAEIEDRHREAQADIAAERERLDGRATDEDKAHRKARAEAEQAVDEAREAFRRAGGR